MTFMISVGLDDLAADPITRVFAIEVDFKRRYPGLLALEPPQAHAIGLALRDALDAWLAMVDLPRAPAAGAESSGLGLAPDDFAGPLQSLHLAVADGFVPADVVDDGGFYPLMARVAQRVGRVLADCPPGVRPADRVALLGRLSGDESDPQRGIVLYTDSPATAAFLFPVVLAGSAALVSVAEAMLAAADSEVPAPVRAAVLQALPEDCARMVESVRLSAERLDWPQEALDEPDEADEADEGADDPEGADQGAGAAGGRDDAGEADDEEGFAILPEDAPFYDHALIQDGRHGGDRELIDPERLGEQVRALQRIAAESAEAQVAFAPGISLVVTPEDVYLGFKTVDEVGQLALTPDDPREFDGEELAQHWSLWYLDQYLPAWEALAAQGLPVRAFPLLEWGRALQRSDWNRPFLPGSAALLPLDAMHREPSRHEIVRGAAPESLTATLFLLPTETDAADEPQAGRDAADAAEADTADTAGDVDEEASELDRGYEFLCAAVRLHDAQGNGVSQENVYATTPVTPARVVSWLRTTWRGLGLPMQAAVTNLTVCDEHLQLMPLDIDEDGGGQGER